jgi:hypothetical protein
VRGGKGQVKGKLLVDAGVRQGLCSGLQDARGTTGQLGRVQVGAVVRLSERGRRRRRQD